MDATGPSRTRIGGRGIVVNGTDTRKKPHSVVSAKTRMVRIDFGAYEPLNSIQEKTSKAKADFTKPTEGQEIVGVTKTRTVKLKLSNPAYPSNKVQEVVGSRRIGSVKISLTNPAYPSKKVREDVGERPRMVGIISTNPTDPRDTTQEAVGTRTRKAKVSLTNPADPLRKVQQAVVDTPKSCDGRRLKKETIYRSVSQEEKILKMSSSANTNKDDFMRKYSQLSIIGKGGFGVVFTGFRTIDSFPVVIKYIPMKHVMWEKVSRSGKDFKVIVEVALMLKAAGPPGAAGKSTSVALLDWYVLDDHLVLVMERPLYCMNLHQYQKSRGGSLTEVEAKVIMKQLVDAAIDMHSKGVFHRDIKSENVLLQFAAGQPRVRVIDFGCGSFSSHTSYHSFSGTLKYYPPEWFRYRTYWAHRTTVWQLGALFYSMLNGDFSTSEFVSNKIQISTLLSREVRSMLETCLHIKPTERATLRELQNHPMFTRPTHSSARM